MAINKAMKMALKALSYPDIDIKKTYKIKRQINTIANPYIKPLYKMWDHVIPGIEHEIPVRIFAPANGVRPEGILIFFHGGGFVVGNIDSYTKVCANMAEQTKHLVVSVDYRLAPEYPFPAALNDCYAVTREIFMDATIFNIPLENITLIGDSAGGNLAASVSLMAKNCGEFLPKKQILLYPSTWNDHRETTPFDSVREFGTDYLLTSNRINDYLDLYQSCDDDRNNPYFAPLLSEDLSNQPKTLIITAGYDPLRDEGEAYGKKLYKFGNDVKVYRMKDALHGFISLPKRFVHVKRAYELINQFLE
ncbi:MAG TPA: alpha/beta hydrolase [Clostridiales bacterium]|nr:alpha/beta hydrolase [Clostridiales bacterium]